MAITVSIILFGVVVYYVGFVDGYSKCRKNLQKVRIRRM